MSWVMWLRVVAVTVVLIPFVQAATRFWAGRAQAGTRHLRVLEACSLGSEGRLYLVGVGDKVYALASGTKGIQVIDEVVTPEVLAELKKGEGVPPERSQASGLARWVSAGAVWAGRLLSGRKPGGFERLADDDENEAVRALQQQLARVRRVGSTGDEALAALKR